MKRLNAGRANQPRAAAVSGTLAADIPKAVIENPSSLQPGNTDRASAGKHQINVVESQKIGK